MAKPNGENIFEGGKTAARDILAVNLTAAQTAKPGLLVESFRIIAGLNPLSQHAEFGYRGAEGDAAEQDGEEAEGPKGLEAAGARQQSPAVQMPRSPAQTAFALAAQNGQQQNQKPQPEAPSARAPQPAAMEVPAEQRAIRQSPARAAESEIVVRRPVPGPIAMSPKEKYVHVPSTDAALFTPGGAPTQAQMLAMNARPGAFEGFGPVYVPDSPEARKEREEEQEQNARLLRTALSGTALALATYDAASAFTQETLDRLGKELDGKRRERDALSAEIARTDEQIDARTSEIATLDGQRPDAENAFKAAELRAAETKAALTLAEADKTAKDELRAATVEGRAETVKEAQSKTASLENSTLKDENGQPVFAKKNKDGTVSYVHADGTKLGQDAVQALKDRHGDDLDSRAVDYQDYKFAQYEAMDDAGHRAMAGHMQAESAQRLGVAQEQHNEATAALDFTKSHLAEIDEKLAQVRKDLAGLRESRAAMTDRQADLNREIETLEKQQTQATEFQARLNDPATKKGIENGTISATDLVKDMPDFMREDFLKENPEIATALRREQEENLQRGPRTAMAAARDLELGGESPGIGPKGLNARTAFATSAAPADAGTAPSATPDNTPVPAAERLRPPAASGMTAGA